MQLPSFQKIALLCICINLISIVIIFLLQKYLPPVVPLFYGLPVGESELAPRLALTIPLLISTLFTVTNIILAKFTKDSFLQNILTGLSITITALGLITVIKIFLLVGAF